MRNFAIFVHVALLGGSLPALAQTNGARTDELDPNERICRRVQPEVGTRIPPRAVCMTRAQWEQQSKTAQTDWERRHRPATGNDR